MLQNIGVASSAGTALAASLFQEDGEMYFWANIVATIGVQQCLSHQPYHQYFTTAVTTSLRMPGAAKEHVRSAHPWVCSSTVWGPCLRRPVLVICTATIFMQMVLA